MTDAERAAVQAILAEKVKDCEGRRREEVRTRDERIAELETENAALRRQVEWLAQERASVSYSFDAEDWIRMAKDAVRD